MSVNVVGHIFSTQYLESHSPYERNYFVATEQIGDTVTLERLGPNNNAYVNTRYCQVDKLLNGTAWHQENILKHD